MLQLMHLFSTNQYCGNLMFASSNTHLTALNTVHLCNYTGFSGVSRNLMMCMHILKTMNSIVYLAQS